MLSSALPAAPFRANDPCHPIPPSSRRGFGRAESPALGPSQLFGKCRRRTTQRPLLGIPQRPQNTALRPTAAPASAASQAFSAPPPRGRHSYLLPYSADERLESLLDLRWLRRPPPLVRLSCSDTPSTSLPPAAHQPPTHPVPPPQPVPAQC